MEAEEDSKTTDLETVDVRGGLEKDFKGKGEDVSEPSAAESVKLQVVQTTATDPVPELEQSLKSVHTETGFRYTNIGGNFFTGIDLTSEDAMRKREERAKRFGTQEGPTQPASFEQDMELDVTKLKARSKRFGTNLLLAEGQPVKFVKSLPPITGGEVRSKAVHLHGLDEMSTEDVFEFFSLYGPRNIEWINDKSCNAVWEDEVSARRALNGLRCQPLAVREEEEEEMQREGEVKDKSGEEERGEGGGGGEGEEPGSDVRWWLAPPHPRAQQLMLRQATTGDVKKPGAARESQYYWKYGNPNIPLEMETSVDLRDRLGRKRKRTAAQNVAGEEEEGGEGQMEVDVPVDPLTSLVKRPKSLHADREEGEEEEEGGREGVGAMRSDSDLRKVLKKKRKWRDLKMRLGSYPRLVEEHT